jgi:tetratricopeptide (TPR) repeat protein
MAKKHIELRWDLPALLFLIISVTMMTDFTRRLMAADPDELNIGVVSVQAFFAVLASSTFTDAGSERLSRLLRRNDQHGLHEARLRCLLALSLLVVVTPFWEWLPEGLASRYNTVAFNLQFGKPQDLSGAIHNYKRAIALNPHLNLSYVNYGTLLEKYYRYDDAEALYVKSIQANPADPVPYNQLARVLLLDGKPLTALRVADDGFKHLDEQKKSSIFSALMKNRAWSEMELGLYEAAVKDAVNADTAAGTCVLAKTLGKMGKADEARDAWTRFRQQMLVRTDAGQTVEPDCTRLAEVANETK